MNFYLVIVCFLFLPVAALISFLIAMRNTRIKMDDCPTGLRAHLMDINGDRSWNLK